MVKRGAPIDFGDQGGVSPLMFRLDVSTIAANAAPSESDSTQSGG